MKISKMSKFRDRKIEKKRAQSQFEFFRSNTIKNRGGRCALLKTCEANLLSFGINLLLCLNLL
jgi:hypothetical protein